MNNLLLVVPSSLENKDDFIRFASSVDISSNISIYFINQSTKYRLKEIFTFSKCNVKEILTNGIVPLSQARNLALKEMYEDTSLNIESSLVMFIDDDAWFPRDTLEYLLSSNIEAICLRTIDPDLNKSFNGLSYTAGEVKGWHLIHDICSICLVVPLNEIRKRDLFFNEKLGLGNEISQGEESLYIYNITSDGLKIHYNEHYIYHPFKISNNMKNYYSLSYFWAWGLTHVSKIFFVPFFKYILKYSVGLILIFKNSRYLQIFYCVWKGAFDGIRNNKGICNKSS